MNSELKKKLKKKKKKFNKLIDDKNYFETFRRVISYNLPRGVAYLGGSNLLLLETEDLQIKREPKNCIFRQAEDEDLDEILALVEEPPLYVREKLFRGYLNDGHICYVLVVDGKIVGYLWVFTGFYSLTYDDYAETAIKITCGKGGVFLGDGYIEPAYRLRGFFPFLMREMSKKLALCGVNKFYAFIGSHNDHSFKSHQGLGFKEFMEFRFFTLLNIKMLSIYKLKNVKRHLRFGRKSFLNSVSCDIDLFP